MFLAVHFNHLASDTVEAFMTDVTVELVFDCMKLNGDWRFANHDK